MKLNQVLDSVSDKLCYLFDRWQDEKEYEDWNDYKVEMKKIAESVEGIQFISAIGPKPDFGFAGRYEKQDIKVLCTDDGGDKGLRISLTTF